MSGALGAWRTAVAQQLRKAGVDAVEAMEPERVPRRRSPAAAVALAGVACGAGGFQDYLGLEQDPDTGGRREVFGREAELTLELEIFAPRDAGASACREGAGGQRAAVPRGGGAGRHRADRGQNGIFGARRPVPAGGALPVQSVADRPERRGGRRDFDRF